MMYTPDPNDIQNFDIYYELSRIEFFVCVCTIALSFITGLLIWNLILSFEDDPDWDLLDSDNDGLVNYAELGNGTDRRGVARISRRLRGW